MTRQTEMPPNLRLHGTRRKRRAPEAGRQATRISSDMRTLSSKMIYALAAIPLLWVAWFYLYVLRQRIHLGFWPLPSHPDPKDAGYALHHVSIYLGVLGVP